MKKINFTLYFLLILIRISAQTATQNYIKTSIYQDAGGTSTLDQIQYFDRLGRPVETVQKAITPLGKDLITYTEYEGISTVNINWLPAPATGYTGEYADKSGFTNLALNQYGSNERPYSLTEYERSPLNRVIGQYGPGAAWDTKKVSTAYLVNEASDVNYYKLNNNNELEKQAIMQPIHYTKPG